jgi:hypothetical protein
MIIINTFKQLICFLPRYQLPAGAPDLQMDRSVTESSASSITSRSSSENHFEYNNNNSTHHHTQRRNHMSQVLQGGSRLQHISTDGTAHTVTSDYDVPVTIHGPRNPPQVLLPARNPPPFSIVDDAFPFLHPLRSMYHWIREQFGIKRPHKHQPAAESIPLELILYFSA